MHPAQEGEQQQSQKNGENQATKRTGAEGKFSVTLTTKPPVITSTVQKRKSAREKSDESQTAERNTDDQTKQVGADRTTGRSRLKKR